jgi:uncharacterized membrane protein YphA (DoxX/SURF4 family)
MKLLRNASRILLGAVFLFSGFVKGIDILGSTYKFTDYFNAFGTEWATGLAHVLAIVLSFSEFAIGAALLLNYYTRIASWLSLIFMSFFLPLTFFIAIKNPVTDCGCFGDALIITNWQTFYKNIVLMALALVVFISRKQFNNPLKPIAQHALALVPALAFAFTAYQSLNHLPIIDFRPYKIGVNISEAMKIPADAPADEYRNEFVYRNKTTGKEEKFNDTNYPWQDTITWEYVSMTSKLVKKGFEPTIHDFTIETMEGEDVAGYFLETENYTLMIIAHNLNKSSSKAQENLNKLASEALAHGLNVVCLTASSEEQIAAFKEKYNSPFEFFFCDEITLKTIVRSNPGIVLTYQGTILNKWHWKDTPLFENLLKTKEIDLEKVR